MIWPRFLQRCHNLLVLSLKIYEDTNLRSLTTVLTLHNACPLLQELSLSSGKEDQDRDLAEFLEACSGISNDNNTTTNNNATIRVGVSRLRLTNTGNICRRSVEALQSCYQKTLTHLSVHGCHGSLALLHAHPLPLPSDPKCDAVHPLLRFLASFESLQVIDVLPVQRVHCLSTIALHDAVHMEAIHLVRQHDWTMFHTTMGLTKTPFTPWSCFATLRIFKMTIGGNILSKMNTNEFGGLDPALLRHHRKICRILGSLTALEQLHLGTETRPLSKAYEVVKSGIESTSNLAFYSSNAAVRATALSPRKPWLVQATVQRFLNDHKKRQRTDQQVNCLLMTLESGLEELVGLQRLEVLELSGMEHRIGIHELEWMVDHWPCLRMIPGLRREGWGNDLDCWIKAHAPFILYT